MTDQERREPHNCTEREKILGMSFSVKRVEENVVILCRSNAEMVNEFKKVVAELAKHMTENRAHQIKIKHLETDRDVLFEKVDDLTGWQNRMRGTLLVVPITCTLISTTCAVFVAFFHLFGAAK